MSVTHLQNSGSAAAGAAEAEATTGVSGTTTRDNAKLEAVATTNSLLALLNDRFEEAFKTCITDEDNEDGIHSRW